MPTALRRRSRWTTGCISRPGDVSIVDRCNGPTLDVGSGPGRLTVALAERGDPGPRHRRHARTPCSLSRAAGALTLLRDVFGQVPGTGRWMTVLLADGNIGIGGDPVALLRRVRRAAAAARARHWSRSSRRDARCAASRSGSGTAARASAWFPWAYVGADQIAEIAVEAGLSAAETWSAARPLVQRAAAAQRLN